MFYEPKPPRVEAWQIKQVGDHDAYNGVKVILEDNRKIELDAGVLSRCPVNPNIGDYVVKNEQGVITLAHKAVFEKAYKAVAEDKADGVDTKVSG